MLWATGTWRRIPLAKPLGSLYLGYYPGAWTSFWTGLSWNGWAQREGSCVLKVRFNTNSSPYTAHLLSPAVLEGWLKLNFSNLILVLRKLLLCGPHHRWKEATVTAVVNYPFWELDISIFTIPEEITEILKCGGEVQLLTYFLYPFPVASIEVFLSSVSIPMYACTAGHLMPVWLLRHQSTWKKSSVQLKVVWQRRMYFSSSCSPCAYM